MLAPLKLTLRKKKQTFCCSQAKRTRHGGASCSKKPKTGVGVAGAAKSECGATYMLFAFDLLISCLHSIQVLEIQFHQPVNLAGKRRKHASAGVTV